jgi:hypothetical protein
VTNSSESQLPKSWIEVSLRELIDVHYGKGLTDQSRVQSGNIPVVGSSGIVGSTMPLWSSNLALLLVAKDQSEQFIYSMAQAGLLILPIS